MPASSHFAGPATRPRRLLVLPQLWRTTLSLALLLCALLLSACSSPPVQTKVRAYSTLKSLPTTPDTRYYRFERLPSQDASNGKHEQLELQTRVALQKVGLQLAGAVGDSRADEHLPAHYSVQVQLRQNFVPYPPYSYDPYWGWGPGFWGPRAWPYWSSLDRLTRSELTLLLRDTEHDEIVFEAHAVHLDLPLDPNVLVAALLESALRDFPNPPSGSRLITIPSAEVRSP